MKFIKQNFGIIIFYVLVISLAFLFEMPKEEIKTKEDPAQDLVVLVNQ